MSIERRKLLRAFGAELVLTDKAKGMKGAVDAAAARSPPRRPTRGSPASSTTRPTRRPTTRPPAPRSRPRSAALELGAFVAGVGTGGTISGAGRYLKERFPGAHRRRRRARRVADHHAEARRRGRSPRARTSSRASAPTSSPTCSTSTSSTSVEQVTGDEAIATARRLAAEEGLLVGISSGANVAAALRLAARPEYRGQGHRHRRARPRASAICRTKLWEELG